MGINVGAVEVDVEPDLSGFGASLKAKLAAATAGASGILGSFKKTLGDTGTAQFSKDTNSSIFALGRFKTALTRIKPDLSAIGKLFNVIKWPAIIFGANVLAGGISALAAGTVALLGGLAPLTGLLVAYPAIMLSVAQGFGVVKLALSGVGEAFKLQAEGGEAYRLALGKLNKSQAAFVRGLSPLTKEFETFKQIASSKFLPQLGSGIDHLSKAFPLLEKIIGSTATEMGKLASQGLKMATSKSWLADIAIIGKGNVGLIHSMGKGFMFLATAMKDILVVAQPLVQWMGKMFQSMMKGFSESVAAGRKSGGLAEFFESAKEAAALLGPILSNVAHSIWNILKAAGPLGTEMLTSIKRITQGWEDFTGSVSGENAIQSWLEESKPVLHEMVLLLRDVFVMFATMGKNAGIANFIGLLRTQLLPVISEIGQTAGATLGPALVDVAAGFLRLFAVFGTQTGVLTTFLEAIGGIAAAFADLLENFPLLAKFLVLVVALAQVSKALGVGDILRAVIAWRTYAATKSLVAAAEAGSTVATTASTTATMASSIASKVAAGAAKLFAGSMKFLNMVLITSPWGLVIASLVGIAAALTGVGVKARFAGHMLEGVTGVIGDAVREGQKYMEGLKTTALDNLGKAFGSLASKAQTSSRAFIAAIKKVLKANAQLAKNQEKLTRKISKSLGGNRAVAERLVSYLKETFGPEAARVFKEYGKLGPKEIADLVRWLQKASGETVTVTNRTTGLGKAADTAGGKIKDLRMDIFDLARELSDPFTLDITVNKKGDTSNDPNIPGIMAKGGLAKRPHLTWIAERGPEVVMPLEKAQQFLVEYANSRADRGANEMVGKFTITNPEAMSGVFRMAAAEEGARVRQHEERRRRYNGGED